MNPDPAAETLGKIRLEIDARVLERLLDNNQIHGEEFRCLDDRSKHCVWWLILMTCSKITNRNFVCNRRCNECGAAVELKETVRQPLHNAG